MKKNTNMFRLVVYTANVTHIHNFVTTICYKDVETVQQALSCIKANHDLSRIKKAYYNGELFVKDGDFVRTRRAS